MFCVGYEIYTTLTSFSTKYLVMCKVYTLMEVVCNSYAMFVHLYVRLSVP